MSNEKNISQILKQRRQELGLSIAHVSSQLHIHSRYLIAIEDNQEIDDLAPIYVMAYLRLYATFLELEIGNILPEWRFLHKAVCTVSSFNVPETYTPHSQPTVMILLSSIVLTCSVYLIWAWFN
jgi:cytoskeletal protein RodZ